MLIYQRLTIITHSVTTLVCLYEILLNAGCINSVCCFIRRWWAKRILYLESGKDGIGTLLEEYDGLMCIDFLENQSEKNTSIEVLLF